MRRYTARSVMPAVVAMAAVIGGSGAAMAVAGSAVRAQSPIFAGFAVSKPTAHVKHVTATFVVPTITCTDTFSGVGPSVLVYSNVNPKTAAHITSGAGLGVACENGNAIYESVEIVNGKPFNDLSVVPGDVVNISVRVVPTATTVTVDDVTSDVSKTRTGRGHTGVQAFIGDNSVVVDNVSSSGKLDPFTPTPVSNVLVNGQRLGSEKPIRYQWVRDGTTLVSAGPLTSGENFTLTFVSS